MRLNVLCFYRYLFSIKRQNYLKKKVFLDPNQNALKQFFIILLSSILLLPSFGNIIIYAKFKIDQDEIVKTICVQRKLPTNTCQGHCALKKSLKELENNEKEMQNNLKEKVELVYFTFGV